MRVAVTGATGLVGTALGESLSRDECGLVLLVRNPDRAKKAFPSAQVVKWEATSGPPPREVLEGLDAVVNLMGEPIAAGRWTKERKKAIRDSRVVGTSNLIEGLSRCQNCPPVLVSFSAIGYYGDRGNEPLEEGSDAGSGFLVAVCKEWEEQAEQATRLGIRVVLMRGGLVLSTRGGALPRILPPFKLCVGGPLGSGGQWMSWIHIDDEVAVIRYAIDEEAIHGPLNCTAPYPVSNKDFSRELGKSLGRPSWMPVPAFALRLLFGEMADTLLQGQRVLPARLQAVGYQFRFPELGGALHNLIRE